jgi:hypothetical protein
MHRHLRSHGGISELTLLYGDFTTCATLEDMKRKYGFDINEIIERWEANRRHESRSSRDVQFIVWLEELVKQSDDHG